MFDIGIWELALIGLLALIILGPNRLPEVARTAGRWVGGVRRFVASVKEDFDQELQTDELVELRKLQQELGETRQLIQRSSTEALDRVQQDLDTEASIGNVEQKPSRKRAKRTRTKSKSKKPVASASRTKKVTSKKKHGGVKRSRKH